MCTINIKHLIRKSKKLVNSTQKIKKTLKKTRIKYFINRESTKKNFKKDKTVRLIPFKGLRYPFIFIKIRIPLKKGLVL